MLVLKCCTIREKSCQGSKIPCNNNVESTKNDLSKLQHELRTIWNAFDKWIPYAQIFSILACEQQLTRHFCVEHLANRYKSYVHYHEWCSKFQYEDKYNCKIACVMVNLLQISSSKKKNGEKKFLT